MHAIYAGEAMSEAVSPILDNSIDADRLSLFTILDTRMREIDKRWTELWIEASDLAITVQDNNLWREGGYKSFESWLQQACPRSRSWVYLAIGTRKELRDISDADLRRIPLGNAEILKSVPKAKRNGNKLLEAAASKPPREFITDAIEAAPEALLEKLVRKTFTASQWTKISEAIEQFRIQCDDPTISDSDALEGIAQEWSESREWR